MNLQQLRDLNAVVTHGGFRAAARALEVSQAGLTKSVARLENEHGLSLIERAAKGVVLTADGRAFLPYAQAAILEADRAEGWLRSTQARRTTRVALGVSVEPSLRLVPAVLQDFIRVLPDVAIHLTQSAASELLAALRDGRIELAVMRLPERLDAADLRVDVLYESEAAIVARKGHPNAAARSISELADLQWVIVGDPGRPGQEDESIQELFIQQQLGRPRMAAVSDSLFGAVSMLMDSDCVARLPRSILDHPLTARVMVEIKVEQPSRRYEVAIVSRASRRLSPEAKTLLAMLRSFARMTRGTVRPTSWTPSSSS
ncbi:LysR family transcriptional regulator [Variovorax paradoxus]|nr:LysR family transcriptional regulator [Variovorax paradoxus]